MSKRVSMFDEMDAAADELRRDNPDLRECLGDELQMTFREIQRRRQPELSTVEWLELFGVWLAEYTARCKREREEAIAWMNAKIDEYARANVPEDPWRQTPAWLRCSRISRQSAGEAEECEPAGIFAQVVRPFTLSKRASYHSLIGEG